MFANVVVDIKSSNVDVEFLYHIPEELEKYVYVGSRVFVEFGVRKILGYVISLEESTTFTGNIKDIIEVLDYSKELSNEQVELAKKISKDTKCLLTSALELMYPSFLKAKYRKFLYAKDLGKLDADISMLFKGKNKIVIDSDTLRQYPKINKEIANGNLEMSFDIYSYGKKKYQKCYEFNLAYENLIDKLSKKRFDCINYIRNNSDNNIDMIRENTTCSKNLIDSLVKDGYLTTKDVLIKEDDISLKNVIRKLNYNSSQEEVVNKYYALSGKPFLLYTNDEDFKLDFYLDIALNTIKNGKKVMIVSPTLLMNFNVLRFFKRSLSGYKIINFSNDISYSSFFDNYTDLLQNRYDIIITTKIGAMLPINDLGLIIIGDTSDTNYINEATPKYNLVEIMKERAKFHKARLVFSTSSPSVELYYNYYLTKYILLKYIKNIHSNCLLVNMKNETGDLVISNALKNEMVNRLSLNKQILLLLNAKGYSNHLVCRKCGEVYVCPKCHIPFTYSKDKDEIKCRYCGLKLENKRCLNCNENQIAMFGIGLEKLNESIQKEFGSYNTLILDGDVVRDYNEYEATMLKIENHEVDIILATNNFVNLKIDDLGLIGIVSIDMILNNNDYRSSQNTFNLITTILKNEDVRTIIQGYNLEHYSIMTSCNNDYDSFYNLEINSREKYQYPPFIEINRLIITGDYKERYHCANYFKKVYRSLFKDETDVLGPVHIPKYQGVQIIIKHNDFAVVSKLIDEVKKKFSDKNITINFERYPKSFS